MKTKEEVRINGKPEFYAVLYPDMKRAALECGYALALHGSMHSDMDLMAMPWIEDAKHPHELVKALDDCVGKTVWKDFKWKHEKEQPHGRISYTISIMGDWHIDLSVMPKNRVWEYWPDKVNAQKLLAIRDALCQTPIDHNEAYHQLCTIADPDLTTIDHWKKLEEIAKD